MYMDTYLTLNKTLSYVLYVGTAMQKCHTDASWKKSIAKEIADGDIIFQ